MISIAVLFVDSDHCISVTQRDMAQLKAVKSVSAFDLIVHCTTGQGPFQAACRLHNK